MYELNNLLQQVSIIQKKYDDLAEYSGEHYNIFDVLGVTSNELCHSAIVTNLLNAKGKHGQKELFLKLFLNNVKEKFEVSNGKKVLDEFDIKNSNAIKEKHTGRVDYEAEQGGRIDIIINDGKSNIIIENKIYAEDQPKQLIRYKEYDKKAPILYLTLDGKEPSPDAKGNLIINKDFVCISYEVFIKEWLEVCIKEMVNKPIIRETLNQYLYIIKLLTNQTTNNKMSEEIVKSMKTNIISSFEISNNVQALKNNLYSEFMMNIKDYANMNNMMVNSDSENDDKDFGLILTPESWKNSSFVIYILFESNNYTGLYVCIKYLNELDENNEVRKKFKSNHLGFVENNWGAKKFPNIYNWGDNAEIWNSIAKGKDSKEYKEIIKIIEEILNIYNS